MYLLDTCVVSEFAKAASHQPAKLRAWMLSVPSDNIVIPVSAILEIECGIQRLATTNVSKADALSSWLDGTITSGLRIQTITAEISRLYARMSARPALKHLWLQAPRKGYQTPGQDLMIAATAIVLEATTLTYNLSDFGLINEHFKLPALMSPNDLIGEVATLDGACPDQA